LALRPSEDREIDTPMAGIRKDTGVDRATAPGTLAGRAADRLAEGLAVGFVVRVADGSMAGEDGAGATDDGDAR
jgi:hypothetical protein